VRSTETRSKVEADAIEAALAAVRALPARYHEILDAVVARRFTFREIVDAHDDRRKADGKWVYEGFDKLLELVHDVELEPLIEPWYASLRERVADTTRDYYKQAVIGFIESGRSMRSQFNRLQVQQWVNGSADVKGDTIRRRASGLASFATYLRKSTDVLKIDPLYDVDLPPAGDPLCNFIETPEAIVLADAQSGYYRLLSGLLAGTGLEVSIAINRIARRDVMRDTREIRAAGTKSYNRDRIVRVADWAWPYVEELIDGRTPNARLLQSIDRYRARKQHHAATIALAEQNSIYLGYTMRDARHTWAVRAVRSGMPIEMVSRQLGHKDGVLALRVYGRFSPRSDERAHWEKIATLQDAARIEAMK
jgi:integrase